MIWTTIFLFDNNTMTTNKRSRRWTKQEIDMLAKHYPESTSTEMAALFGGKYDTQAICNKANTLAIHKSQAYHEKYGIDKNGKFLRNAVPWNKGIKFEAGGKSELTRFKPGRVPPNHRPVGSIRIDKDGYTQIKVDEGKNKFRLLHREIWKQHHGSYPARGTAIKFKDGNKANCSIDNLEIISRAELMRQNSMHNMPEQIRSVIHTRISLIRRINDNYPKKRHKQTA